MGTEDRPEQQIAAAPFDIPFWVTVVAIEGLLVSGYFAFTTATITAPRYVLYPFVWINAGLWAMRRSNPPDVSGRPRQAAIGIAGLYFLTLSYLAGLIAVYSVDHGHALTSFALPLTGASTVGAPVVTVLIDRIGAGLVPLHGAGTVSGIQISMASPGWGPRIALVAPGLGHVYVVPYRTFGYLALSYLVYVAVLDTVRAAVSGVLGVGACIGCSFPIVASLVTGLVGSSSVLAETVRVLSIDISTAVFLLALGLLYWRPGFGD